MKRSLICLAVVALAGCGGPGSVVHSFKDGDLTTSRHVSFFAHASAGQMFDTGFLYVSYFINDPLPPGCPVVTDDGKTLTVKKGDGCQGQYGGTFYGTMTFVRAGGSIGGGQASSGGTGVAIPFGTVTFDGFGQTSNGQCWEYSSVLGTLAPKTTGTATISGDGKDTARFTVDLRTDQAKTPTSCPPTPLTTAADYQGTVTLGAKSTTFAGSGTFGTSVDGKVSATTKAELFDQYRDVISGTTTLRAGGHVAVITYQPPKSNLDFTYSASTWTLDGKDQGVVPGATCATMPGRGGMPGLLSVLTLLGLALLRRRRLPR